MSSKSTRTAGIVNTMVAFHRNEMKMLDRIDKRKRSGKSNEDDDHANAHVTHVAADGTKT